MADSFLPERARPHGSQESHPHALVAENRPGSLTIGVHKQLVDCLYLSNVVLYAGQIGSGRADASMGMQPCAGGLREDVTQIQAEFHTQVHRVLRSEIDSLV